MLLEEFKNHLPDRVVVHLNEQRVATLAQAAVMADEYALTHKTVFLASRFNVRPNTAPVSAAGNPSDEHRPFRDTRECYYCHQTGHGITDCPVLKSKLKHSGSPTPKPKSMSLEQTKTGWLDQLVSTKAVQPDPSYAPFLSKGCVSLTGQATQPIRILRDTGAAQSIIVTGVLPWSDESYCGLHVLLQGIETKSIPYR